MSTYKETLHLNNKKQSGMSHGLHFQNLQEYTFQA